MGIFIFDELTGLPTILATNRVKRPDNTGAVSAIHNGGKGESDSSSASTVAGGSALDKNPDKILNKACLFCKGQEGLTPPSVYQDTDDWNVRVFKNKFPLVDDHEILVHSPDHEKDMEDLTQEQNIRIIRAYLNRVHFYNSTDKEVMVFNNKGGKAGASITHPHSQIIALKGFPGIIEKEKEEALRYFNSKNRCYWCDEINSELNDKKRVVFESPHYVLMVPRASRWSYELSLIPKEHKPNFEFINEVEINDLAFVMKSALMSYDKLLKNPDRNFWLHTMRYEPYHWHMGFIPHVKVLGGLELGAGIWVSDRATPEDAATQLGELVRKSYEECSGISCPVNTIS